MTDIGRIMNGVATVFRMGVGVGRGVWIAACGCREAQSPIISDRRRKTMKQ